MSGEPLVEARRALAECEAVVDRLHELCCEPNRSPRLIAIKEGIDLVRTELDRNDGAADLESALSSLMDIGAQIGHLQVGCCAPARMPLYADALSRLTTAQLDITGSFGTAH